MIPAGYGLGCALYRLESADYHLRLARRATAVLGWSVFPLLESGQIFQAVEIRVFGDRIRGACFSRRRLIAMQAWCDLLAALVLLGIRVEALAPTSFFSKPGAGRGAGQAQLATGARRSGFMQGRSVADHRIHNPELVGSIPAPAPTLAPSASHRSHLSGAGDGVAGAAEAIL